MDDRMDELNRYQESVIESLEQENDKYIEVNNELDFDSILTKGKLYYNKLLNIKKDMQSLSERSDRLRRRALKLQNDKEVEALRIESERDRELEREKQLQPVVPNVQSKSS